MLILQFSDSLCVSVSSCWMRKPQVCPPPISSCTLQSVAIAQRCWCLHVYRSKHLPQFALVTLFLGLSVSSMSVCLHHLSLCLFDCRFCESLLLSADCLVLSGARIHIAFSSANSNSITDTLGSSRTPIAVGTYK